MARQRAVDGVEGGRREHHAAAEEEIAACDERRRGEAAPERGGRDGVRADAERGEWAHERRREPLWSASGEKAHADPAHCPAAARRGAGRMPVPA